MKARVTILLTVLLTGHCYGQWTLTPVGLYKASDIGNWTKILLIYDDSTYQFVTKTDMGSYPVEPGIGELPKWTLDPTSNKLTLRPTKDFKPKIDILYLQVSADLLDSNQKRWTKFADIDSIGGLKTFKEENGRIITYNAKGHPVQAVKYKDSKIIEKQIFYKLDSLTEIEAKHFFATIRKHDNNPYLNYVIYNSQMADFYAIISTEEILVNGSWTTINYDIKGKPIKSK